MKGVAELQTLQDRDRQIVRSAGGLSSTSRRVSVRGGGRYWEERPSRKSYKERTPCPRCCTAFRRAGNRFLISTTASFSRSRKRRDSLLPPLRASPPRYACRNRPRKRNRSHRSRLRPGRLPCTPGRGASRPPDRSEERRVGKECRSRWS